MIYLLDSIYYIFAFIGGFFAREIYQRYIKINLIKKDKSKTTPLKNIDTPSKLLNLAISLRYKYNLDKEIQELEKLVYKNQKNISFSKLKKDIAKKLS
jgi:hypothetical protein